MFKINKNGFSLIELLVAMIILSILMVFAYPTFKVSQENNRLVSQVNQLNNIFSLARSEAFRLNEYVSICATDNYTECNADDFSTGIIIFKNPNKAGLSDESQIIKVYDKWEGSSKGIITVSDGSSVFTFNGVPNVISSGNVLVCKISYVSYSLTVSSIGGLNIVKNEKATTC